MIFCFRPCPRKARWRKRQFSRAAMRLLACIVALAAFAGLLFIAPQWLLVLAVILLCLSLVYLAQR